MEMPSGRRSSEPVPVPSASGTAPRKAAQGGHHDGPEPEKARAVNRLLGRHLLVALRLKRKVDHHDGVLLHDADEQDDADEGDDRKLALAHHERQERADARGRQRGKNGDRVDVALVEDAEHDVDGDERGEDEHRLARERFAEGARRAREAPRARPAGRPISSSTS